MLTWVWELHTIGYNTAEIFCMFLNLWKQMLNKVKQIKTKWKLPQKGVMILIAPFISSVCQFHLKQNLQPVLANISWSPIWGFIRKLKSKLKISCINKISELGTPGVLSIWADITLSNLTHINIQKLHVQPRIFGLTPSLSKNGMVMVIIGIHFFDCSL